MEPRPTKEENILLSAAKAAGGGMYHAGAGLLNLIGIPQQAVFRNLMSEREAEAARRRSGSIGFRDVLRANNVIGPEDTYPNWWAGFAGDVFLDPTNLIGIGVANKGGKALRAAGAAQDLGRTASQGIKAGVDLGDDLARAFEKGVGKMGKTPATVSAADLIGSPPIGKRFASRHLTLDKIKAIQDAGVEVPNLDRVLSKFSHLDDAARSRIMAQPLAKGLTFAGIPTRGIPVAGPVLDAAAGGISNTLDWAGQIYKNKKYGTPLLRKLFDKSVDSADDAPTQRLVSGINQAGDEAYRLAKRRAAREAAELAASKESKSIFSEAGNKTLADMIERPRSIWDETKGKVLDTTVRYGDTAVRESGAAQKYVDWWAKESADELAESAKYGLRSDQLKDPNVEGYLPRKAGAAIDQYFDLHQPRALDANTNKLSLSSMTSDQLARSDALKLPGGRNALTFGLAKDPRLVGPKRLAKTDDEAAEIIGNALFGKGAHKNRKQSRQIAHILHSLPDESTIKTPLYGQHPTEAITEYVAGRAKARKIAEMKIEHIAANATDDLSGTTSAMSVKKALQEVGLKKEARNMLTEMIAKRTGKAASEVDLRNLYVPGDVMKSLTHKAPIYKPPAMDPTGSVGGLWHWAQSVWRNGVLNWPARFLRDKLGGMFVNHYNGMLSPRGEMLSAAIIKNGIFDKDVVEGIAKMPNYSHLPNPLEAAKAFYADLQSTEILDVGRRLDLGVAGEAIHQSATGLGSGSTALPTIFFPMQAAGGALADSWKNIATMFDREGAFAKGGALAGDIIDQSNRLSGYVELMFRGVDPQEAARVVKKAHVDYSSLTNAEKRIRDFGMPFYTFASRMLGEMVDRIITDPGKVKRTLEVLTAPQQNNEPGTPDYIANRFGFNMGGGNYLYGHADIPGFEQLPLLMALARGDTRELASQTGGMLNPVAKGAVEFFSGRQMAPGALPTDQYRGNIQRALNIKDQNLGLQLLDYAVNSVPTGSRFSNLARELLEERRNPSPLGTFPSALLGNLTGIRVRPVSTMDQLGNMAEEQINRVKGMTNKVKSYEQNYISKDDLEALRSTDPRAAQEYDVYQRLKKARTDRIRNSQKLTRGMSNRG